MTRRWPIWAFTALSVAVLAAGFAASGGPAQGRAEKRDRTRDSDLSAIQMLLSCKADAAGRLITDPTPTEACPMTPRLADPFTGAPYRIEPIAPASVRLCADFELPPDLPGRDASGCSVHRVVAD